MEEMVHHEKQKEEGIQSLESIGEDQEELNTQKRTKHTSGRDGTRVVA